MMLVSKTGSAKQIVRLLIQFPLGQIKDPAWEKHPEVLLINANSYY